MGVFDQAARYGAKIEPPGFFRWLLPGGEVKPTFRGWLDTRTMPFPGEPDRVCDTVAELADENPGPVSVALVTEFHSPAPSQSFEFPSAPGRRTVPRRSPSAGACRVP